MIEKQAFRHVVIYLRTSTEDQNPENQLADCESIRPKNQKCDTFVDYSLIKEQSSAWKGRDRPEFDRLINLIKARKIKHLIVWDLDRIERNRKRLIAFFELCKAYKCSVHSFRQRWLEDINNMPSPWNEIIHGLMLQIMGWLAQDESDKKSKRVKSAVRQHGEITVSYKGNRWGRKPLSTFKVNKIRELHNEGLSLRKIAAELGISKSAVHKTIHAFTIDNNLKSKVSLN